MTSEPSANRGAAAASASVGRGRAAQRVTDLIRAQLRSQELLPGQPLRQDALAASLGVSRVPVREALKTLESEGVVQHTPNAGYTVVRLSNAELQQSYTMRRLLESELLKSLPRLSRDDLAELQSINERVKQALSDMDVSAASEANREFHFTMFRHSGQEFIVAELERIWKMTDAYRSLYLYDAHARRVVCHEHTQMITALRRGHNERVVELMNQHRGAAQLHIEAPAGPGFLLRPGS